MQRRLGASTLERERDQEKYPEQECVREKSRHVSDGELTGAKKREIDEGFSGRALAHDECDEKCYAAGRDAEDGGRDATPLWSFAQREQQQRDRGRHQQRTRPVEAAERVRQVFRAGQNDQTEQRA